MKKNLIYLAGALLSSAILTFSCTEDDIPSYSDVSVDKNDLFIKIENPTAEVNITNGNGNYKVTVADENIATATLDGTRITINGLKNGTTTATVMDWAKRSAVINIKVKEDFELKLDKKEVVMFLGATDPKTEKISITSGNDNYTVESSDANVATAELDADGKVLITAIANGFCDVTVTDGDGLKTTVKVKVCEKHLELEDVTKKICIAGESINIAIISGNGDYTVASEKPEIATAEIVDGAIKVNGLAKGETNITVTDKMGLSVTCTIKVSGGFKTEKTHIDNVWIGEEAQEIAILDGSGSYTIESGSYIDCTLSEDKSKLLIKGIDKKIALNQKITVTDKLLNKTIEITIGEVNYRFEVYGTARWFIEGALGEPKTSTFTTSGNKEYLKVGEKKYSFSPISNGFSLSFEGGREVGKKINAVLWHLNSSGKEVNQVNISDMEIIKTEDINDAGNGKYWIKFREDGKEEDSYIITWT